MNLIVVKEWQVEEKDLIYLMRLFIPYRKKYGQELGFEHFFEDHKDFCLQSGLDAIETTLLHEWKGKYRYQGGKRHRYVRREHTEQEWQQKLAEYNYSCAYCGVKRAKITKDHIIPISKGGSDKIENILPACWPCNLRKRAKIQDSMRQRIENWIIVNEGWFDYFKLDKALCISTPAEKALRRVIIWNMVKAVILDKDNTRRNTYRKSKAHRMELY